MSRITALVYSLLYVLAWPAILVSLLRAPGKAYFGQRFGFALQPQLRRSVWLHASSVGEVALLEPLVAELQRRCPNTPLLITAFTATGIGTAQQRFSDHTVRAAPFDFRFIVRRFIRHYDPQLVVVVESEFWPGMFGATHSAGVPLMVLNGKMSERSLAVHLRTRLVAEALRCAAAVAVLDEVNARRMQRLGLSGDQIHVTGNMKYDLVAPNDDALNRAELGIAEDAFVVVAGSLHDGETSIVLDAVFEPDAISQETVLLAVPRYPDASQGIADAAAARGLRTCLRSAQLAGSTATDSEVIVVDTLGELRALYGIANAVFVGGSLAYRGSSKGGHNLMEPAICAVPVLFGPYNYSFADIAAELARRDGGRQVSDAAQMRAALLELVADSALAERMGAAARGVVLDGQGATAGNLALVFGQLEQGSH